MDKHALKAQAEEAKAALVDCLEYSDCIDEAQGHFADWKEAMQQLNQIEQWEYEQEEAAYRDAERRFGC